MSYRNEKEMASRRSAESTKRNFDKFISASYYKLREKCLFTNTFGELVYLWQEDIFHNTYLAVREALTTEKEEAFEEMFVSSFKLYTKRAFTARVREIVPEETFWRYQKQVEEETEEDEARKEAKHDLAVQLIAASKMIFSRDEQTIFKLHFESNFNFRQIGDIFGTSGEAVQYRYNKLCCRLFNMYNSLNTL